MVHMKTKLILVRHGHCEKSGTYCGSSDAPLTEKGRQQAVRVAQELAVAPISFCHASPLSRAYETAQIICSARQVSIVPAPSLKEIDFGLWEGLTYREISQRWPEQVNKWLSNPTGATIPGGESFSGFRHRIRMFLQELSHKKTAGDILIVAHGGSIAVLLMEIHGKSVSEFFQLIPPLGSVQTIEWVMQDAPAEAH